jgi:autotransporter-associated beta strand protein
MSRLAAALLLLLITSPAALAQTWNQAACADGSNWSTAACWDTGSVPPSGADVTFAAPGTPVSNADLNVPLSSVTLNPNGSYRILGTVTLGNGGSITSNTTGSGDQDDIDAGVVLTGSATFVRSAGGNQPMKFNGVISGDANLTLVSTSGDDQLRVTASNTYTGATTVGGTGRVLFDVDGAVPRGSALTVDGSALFMVGSMIGSLAGGGTVTMNGDNALIVGGDNTDTTFSGVYQNGDGSASLTKVGTGRLTLNGANTYTGGTTVSAGTLAGTTTGLQGNITNNAAVVFDQNTDGTYAGVMSGSGTLSKSGTGRLTLTGANTYTGGTTVSAGTLAGTTTGLQGNITNNAAVVFDQNTNGTYAGVMSGLGTLSKSGTGTLTLSGNNTFTGGTNLNAGTIRIENNSALGTGTLTIFGSTLDYANGIRIANAIDLRTDSTLNVSSGSATQVGAVRQTGGVFGITKTGSGTLTLTGSHTYTGTTVVEAGTLALDGATLAGSADIRRGTLSGTGTIGGSLTLAGGAAIATPGRLQVGQNLIVSGGGLYQPTVRGMGDSGLLAVSGSAAIAGAVIAPNLASSARVTQAAILTASGGVSGTPSVQSSTRTIEGSVVNDGHTLYLVVLNAAVPLAPSATTTNAAAVGGAVDRVRASATGDLAAVARELTALDDAGLASALDQISGEIHATSMHAVALESEAMSDVVRAEVAAGVVAAGPESTAVVASGNPWGTGRRFWGRFLGQRADTDPSTSAHGGDATLGGIEGGVWWALGANWLVGVAAGYGVGHVKLHGLTSSSDVNTPRAFGYLGYGGGHWIVHVGGSAGRTSYDARRSMAFTAQLDPQFGALAIFSGVNRTASAKVDGVEASGWVDVAGNYTAGTWLLQPGVGVRRARYQRSAWTESGADALSLSAPSQSLSSSQADASLRFTRARGRVRPYALASYRRELGEGLTTTTLQLSGDATGRYTVQGLPFALNRGTGGAGFSTRLGEGADVSVGYRIEGGSSQLQHFVDVGVRF